MLEYIKENVEIEVENIEDKVVQIAWIKGYEGYYKIDSNGTIWSYHSGKRRRKRVFLGGSGKMYKRVELHKKGKSKKYYVHRLLAEAFLPKVEGKYFINHIDGDRWNNELTNLEWCTIAENAQHYWQNRRKKEKSEMINLSGCLNKHSDLGFKGLGNPLGI